MSFREKSAWISLISILLLFGIYFTAVALDYASTFALFIQLVIGFVVIEIVLHIVVATKAPLDAKAPKDERERLIGLKADRVAGYVLVAGVFFAIFTVHLSNDARDVAHAALFAFAVSQLAKYGTEIALHRRDA
jgi:hypothetical protein